MIMSRMSRNVTNAADMLRDLYVVNLAFRSRSVYGQLATHVLLSNTPIALQMRG